MKKLSIALAVLAVAAFFAACSEAPETTSEASSKKHADKADRETGAEFEAPDEVAPPSSHGLKVRRRPVDDEEPASHARPLRRGSFFP